MAQQYTVWEWKEQREVLMNDSTNGLGPFILHQPVVPCRHMDCPNYDGCLSFVAVRKWLSFSCEGCRKAQGTFE